jgi:hypothetical protein
MATQPEITQRDLRDRSKEIMDAVENGQAFTVTRGLSSNSHPIMSHPTKIVEQNTEKPEVIISRREPSGVSQAAPRNPLPVQSRQISEQRGRHGVLPGYWPQHAVSSMVST